MRRGTPCGRRRSGAATAAGSSRCASRSRNCASPRPIVTRGASTSSASSSAGTNPAWLQLVRKNESGLASKMARLEGIAGIDPPTTLELLPYVTAREEFVAPVLPGSPFNDGSRFFGGAGLDMKYGLSSSLTLDATFNPDFGQVEVDPAVVNLSQFETFFEERRPFFTEGAKVFGDFGRSGASQYLGVLPARADALLQPPHRPLPAGQGERSLRGHPGLDHHPRRGQGGRACPQGLDVRRARGGDRARVCRSVERRAVDQGRSRAAHQLHRVPRPARTGAPRRHRPPGHVGVPRSERARARLVSHRSRA